MSMPDGLRRLLEAHGPSGYEQEAAAVFRELAGAVSDDVTWDTSGSTVARVPGRGEGPVVAVIGHIDEIGVIVSHIDENGFLRFRGVGGWDAAVLIGQRVELTGRKGRVPGVIARPPVHTMEAEQRAKLPKLKGLHIDIGARDADEARELVRIGDVGVLGGAPQELPNGRIVSRALDNRLGCWVALEVARLVSEGTGVDATVVAVAATQEELVMNQGGARAVAHELRPDMAIVVDVTWETKQPGVEVGESTAMEFGGGPVISRGPQLHPAITDGLAAAAEAEKIDHVIEATARGTFTDADSVYMERGGIATGLVSIPTRYLHSPAEMCQLSDIEGTAAVIAAFVRGLGPDTDLRR
jgi:putative aminopeptidase FrvX